MRVLLDESVPVQVRGALPAHDVETVDRLGWKGKGNGELLADAESAGFDILVVADKNLRHQQNLRGRRIAVVEVWTNHRPTLERNFPVIAASVAAAVAGQYLVVPGP